LAKIPILSYHSIDAAPDKARFPGLHVPPELFERQMWTVKRLGFRCISMSEAYRRLQSNDMGRCVALTFDDGYLDNILNAAPILKQFTFEATCYVVADLVGSHSVWDVELGGSRPLMGREQLEQWLAQGLEVGSHTRSHPRLDELSAEAAREEIAGSRVRLSELLGTEIRHFCYPYGRFSATASTLVREAGYQTAVTTLSGVASKRDDPYRLPRIAASSSSLFTFLIKVFTPFGDYRREAVAPSPTQPAAVL
jgi:peptidoglycan/xylan/chitin deacetylase (PgdA/CDA1 family)